MTAIPEGVQTVSGEGSDVKAAVTAAAKELGLDTRDVGYTIDFSHFRSNGGSSVARTTVKVIAWAQPAGAEAPPPPPKPKPAPAPRAAEDEEERPAPPPRRSEPSAPAESTEASEFAAGWFRTLLELMDVKGTAEAVQSDDRIRLTVTADQAGRIIGRKGATLAAIRGLLKQALRTKELGDFVIDVDIPDDREGRGPRPERSERSGDRGDRGDRGGRDRDRGGRGGDRGGRGGGGERGGRDRDRDRGPRGGDRGGDRGPRGGGEREAKGDYPEDKLRALAQKAARKAKETGRPVTINLLLNSYDRHVVHTAATEVEGISSQSVIKDGKKYVQVFPEMMVEE